MAITAGSTVAWALLDSSSPLGLHSQFSSGVNLRCEDYLIYVSADPRGGACSLQAEASDVEVLRTSEVWGWTGEALLGESRGQLVEVDPAAVRYPVGPGTLERLSGDPERLHRARAAVDGTSWFDTGAGREVGLPRLQAAIERLTTGAPDAADAFRAVVGMGVGLTPSADDALVGALCLLAAVGSPFPHVRDVDAWLRAEGARATTDVAASYLRLALQGAFSAPVGRTVLSLGADTTDARLVDAVRGLLAIGATSGMDTAVGIQIAWASLVPTGTADRF